MDIFFKSNENFDKIIVDTLKGKKIVKANQITTGWTNIVYEVETDDGNYFFRFPRDEFWSRTIVKDCEFAGYIYNKTDFTFEMNQELSYINSWKDEFVKEKYLEDLHGKDFFSLEVV
jgi:fructosamine-3-kinase